MPVSKTTFNGPLLEKPRPGMPPKRKSVNFFFTQDSQSLERKWTARQNFWNTTRPNTTNVADRWDAFEDWRARQKD